MVQATLPVQAASQPAVTQAWMPFDSAPVDGSEIIVYRDDAGVFTAHFTSPMEMIGSDDTDDDELRWFTIHGEDLTEDLPTHWMPLPLPPDDRTNVSVAQDSCLNQTLIDSAVSTAIERCAKVADDIAEWEGRGEGKRLAEQIATAIRALSTGGKDGQ